MPTEHQKNHLASLRRTLEDLASADRQRRYKAQVPFVHVPIELVEQWTGHERLLRDQVPSWVRVLFDHNQTAAMHRFGAIVSCTLGELGEELPDVPEILDREPWRRLGQEAQYLLALLSDGDTDRVAG